MRIPEPVSGFGARVKAGLASSLVVSVLECFFGIAQRLLAFDFGVVVAGPKGQADFSSGRWVQRLMRLILVPSMLRLANRPCWSVM